MSTSNPTHVISSIRPVPRGDEIDAAMDAERAGFTAECLRGLTSTIKQVVLVSHKEHQADHQIRVAA